MDVIVGTLFVGFLVAPVILMLLGIFVLLLGHVTAPPPVVGRTTVECPRSHKQVNVAFESWPGFDRPGEVVSCSAFKDPEDVRCEKACLGLVGTRWVPSPIVPRYSLIADGVAYRSASERDRP